MDIPEYRVNEADAFSIAAQCVAAQGADMPPKSAVARGVQPHITFVSCPPGSEAQAMAAIWLAGLAADEIKTGSDALARLLVKRPALAETAKQVRAFLLANMAQVESLAAVIYRNGGAHFTLTDDGGEE